MKTDTSNLTGAALDWAVATCEGGEGLFYDTIATYWIKLNGEDRALSKGWAQSFTPSTDWAQGGPIIEREHISVEATRVGDLGDRWMAEDTGHCTEFADKPLVAAMRCYVASRLGEQVDIPEELL